MELLKTKKNKARPNRYAKRSGRGFALLFAVMLSSILLAIAIGVADVSLQEIKFGTSARDSNDAFFAADTGSECALFNDKSPTKFPLAGPATSINCANLSITPTFSGTGTTGNYIFTITGLGSLNQSCATINISKDNTVPPLKTTIVSKGYNTCASGVNNKVERELDVTY